MSEQALSSRNSCLHTQCTYMVDYDEDGNNVVAVSSHRGRCLCFECRYSPECDPSTLFSRSVCGYFDSVPVSSYRNASSHFNFSVMFSSACHEGSRSIDGSLSKCRTHIPRTSSISQVERMTSENSFCSECCAGLLLGVNMRQYRYLPDRDLSEGLSGATLIFAQNHRS